MGVRQTNAVLKAEQLKRPICFSTMRQYNDKVMVQEMCALMNKNVLYSVKIFNKISLLDLRWSREPLKKLNN